MPITSWTKEVLPGGVWTYNDSRITYNDVNVFQGAGTIRYNQIGEVTSWTKENK